MGLVSRQDLKITYEGIFLSTYSYFENFLEALFVGLLVENIGVYSTRTDIHPRIKMGTHQIVMDSLINTSSRTYLDWIPYKEITLKRADIYFRGGRPFSDINNTEMDTIFYAGIIRNSIAHKSKSSLDKFRKHLIGARSIAKSQQQPAGYLMGIFRRHPIQTRYENIAGELLQIAYKLSR
jgi:hypothetical protein